MKKNVYRILWGLAIQCLVGLQLAYGATYYVATTGNDSNSGTALSAPFRTINQAVRRASSSGDIIYVMTGTYNEVVNINQSGITLSAYPDNRPVIDGASNLPGYAWGHLVGINGNYNKFSGFEVKNCNYNGTYAGGTNVWLNGHHNTVSRVNSHHAWGVGILAAGDYSIVEDSRIWQNTRDNSNNNDGSTSGGWGTGISAARNRNSAAIKPGINSYSILRRNIVYNNWGEGISCYEADHCTLEDNIVYDNWTNNLYVSDTTNSLIQRNIVYISSNPAIPFRGTAHTGITLADEVASLPRSANNTIINNFLYNVDFGAFFWTLVSGSGLNNVLIAYNTIVDGNLLMGSGGGSNITNVNSQVRNNIFLGRNNGVPSRTGITFSNNNWAVTPSQAGSSTDVIGNPQIARAGSTSQGALTAEFFKILDSSAVINRAVPLSTVTGDFFKMARGNSPDIGGHEFSTPAPTPAPAPAPTATVTPSPTPAPVTGSNLALNRPVTVSSTEPADSNRSYDARFAVDGDGATRWSSAFADSQSITVDLGSPKQINRVVLNWEVAYGKSFEIQVSDDNTNWSTIYSTTTGDGGIDDLTGLSGIGRYIRMFGSVRGTPWGFSLYELSVFGSDASLSYKRPVMVSSTEPADSNRSYDARFAVDGDGATRWSSAFADSQSITVDLGSRKQINRVVLNWEVAYGKSYQIQVSDDNTNWRTIYSTTTGDGGIDDLTGLSGIGRYIRMFGSVRGTPWGFSLYEINVFGN